MPAHPYLALKGEVSLHLPHQVLMTKLIIVIAALSFALTFYMTHNLRNEIDQTESVKILSSYWPNLNMDPARLETAGDWVTLQNLYSTLVQVQGSDAVKPGLAEEWLRTPDGLEWRFKLRSGLKWSNGEIMTADQIVWSLKRATSGTTHTDFSSFVEAITTENNQIIIRLNALPSNFLVMLGYVDMSIIHPLSIKERSFQWDAPTSGPMVIDIISDQHFKMKANRFYWAFDPNRPQVFDLYEADSAPSDVQTLLGGDWDICHTSPGIVTPTDLLALKKMYHVLEGDSDFLMSLFFSKKWSQKKSMRRALLKSVHSRFWKDASVESYNQMATGLRPPGIFGSLDINQFQFLLSKMDDAADWSDQKIVILTKTRQADMPSAQRLLKVLKSLFREVVLIEKDHASFRKLFKTDEYDLALRLLGASEGDPDSAWRIYNKDFFKPLASPKELNIAQQKKSKSGRQLEYEKLEKRALNEGVFIPVKNLRTYVFHSRKIEISLDQSTDWGLQLDKIKFQ